MMGAQLVKLCACMKLPNTHGFGMHANLNCLANATSFCHTHGHGNIVKYMDVILFLRMYNYKMDDYSKIRQPRPFGIQKTFLKGH